MVGSILFEYLLPLMQDKYILEDLIVQFFFELAMIPKPELFELSVVKSHLDPGERQALKIRFGVGRIVRW